MKIHAIVTDIEGTTSSIAFVHEVLFPYASREISPFVSACHTESEIADLIEQVRIEAGEPDASLERVVQILLDWIAQDRKATPLKALQGHIWRRGYEQGHFTGHIYADAAACLRQWSETGIDLYVYSSGSVGAQQLLFGHSDEGDLRPLFKGYFDTRTGHKQEPESYRNIIAALELPAQEILFLSDVAAELDAAAECGMQTIQLVRQEDIVTGTHPVAATFHDIHLNQ